MQLTVEHIKNAKASQLAKLLGKKLPAISRWNKTDFVTGSVDSKYNCISKQDLVAGLIARKERLSQMEIYQQEFDEILENSEKLEETAVA